MSKKITKAPRALFDTLDYIHEQSATVSSLSTEQRIDYTHARAFLKCYVGSVGTFNAYRREVERLLHWSFFVKKCLLKDLKRNDIEAFIKFCQNPPRNWIGIKKATRFIHNTDDSSRIANPEWRPFVSKISKLARNQGKSATVANFSWSDGTIKECFAILNSFYNYLIQEHYTLVNPVALVRQKSRFVRKSQTTKQIRRLTPLQWKYLISTVEAMAVAQPHAHERTLFMISALYAMYLRVSELVATQRWCPMMHHFYRDAENAWWFITVGKGNKERHIAVSDAMLASLKRYRKSRNMSALPSRMEKEFLLPKIRGKGPITSTTYVRELLQKCFDQAVQQLMHDQHEEEAIALIEATVHWLRHTGISEDVKHRPREHVRDDAGHSSSITTDRYIDVALRERHASAKNKPILVSTDKDYEKTK